MSDSRAPLAPLVSFTSRRHSCGVMAARVRAMTAVARKKAMTTLSTQRPTEHESTVGHDLKFDLDDATGKVTFDAGVKGFLASEVMTKFFPRVVVTSMQYCPYCPFPPLRQRTASE